MDTKESRSLSNNGIKQFIIRIDLLPTDKISFESFANAVAPHYSGLVKLVVPHLNINLSSQEFEQTVVTHYQIKIEEGVDIKMDPVQNCIIFESNHYISNDLYKSTMSNLFGIMKSVMGEKRLIAKRIGMRYINYYAVSSKDGIGEILNEADNKSLIHSLGKENVNRVIFVEEQKLGDKQVRIQYGVPNNRYPNLISSLDILLDIDVYTCTPISVEDWDETLSECNHIAYDNFKKYIKQSYIESLK